jgi:hypothetical protein
MLRTLFISAVFVSLAGTSAFAADPAFPPVIQEDWTCGTLITPTPFVTAFFTPTYTVEQSEQLPTFMAGEIKDPAGGKFSALFIEKSNGWQGYAVESQAGFSDAFVSRNDGKVVLFSMVNSEAPGHAYTVVSTQDGFKTLTCGELPAPDTKLDILDYMQIKTFDLDEKGHGELTGIVRFSDEKKSECFRATTDDNGRTWTKPKRVSGACIDSIVEPLEPVPELSGPLQNLKAYSGG